ncbi:unnamed protein product [Lactuca virosa]|uniref:Replication protein A 70 kDa DNA-binding subunit B/D first OB fold domain-containing protein n=1 Tax=Lactuca virosa TaxID=75947 RepID=A0AAU9MPX3_9ASTR|nr:unnamed protein product [Lactuca virosa]
MAHNSGDEIVFDSLADIDASNETWNIRVHVLMLWKQTYKNNPNMVSSLDMILMDQQGLSGKSINLLNTDTVVAKAEDYYLRFPIKNIDDIPDYNKTNASIHFYCHDCSKKVSKNDDDSNVEPFTCDGCGGVSDVYGKMRVVIRVQDKTRIKDVKISLMSLIAF